MFIPARTEAMKVLTGRSGEGSRPWSAGAGATVTTTALAVVTYMLSGLRRLLPQATASTDWTEVAGPGRALFFEAFVTGVAKGDDHAHDALLAAEAARELLCGSRAYRSAIDEAEVFNMLGASLLRTGWSTDLSLLSTPCLVVKPGFDHSLSYR